MRTEEAWEDLYKKIYVHHYEIIKSEPGESRDAKLSLSNWILDMMTGYEIEERPTAKWIDSVHEGYCTCSICGGYHWLWLYMETQRFKYCPHCGARMAESEEEVWQI